MRHVKLCKFPVDHLRCLLGLAFVSIVLVPFLWFVPLNPQQPFGEEFWFQPTLNDIIFVSALLALGVAFGLFFRIYQVVESPSGIVRGIMYLTIMICVFRLSALGCNGLLREYAHSDKPIPPFPDMWYIPISWLSPLANIEWDAKSIMGFDSEELHSLWRPSIWLAGTTFLVVDIALIALWCYGVRILLQIGPQMPRKELATHMSGYFFTFILFLLAQNYWEWIVCIAFW